MFGQMQEPIFLKDSSHAELQLKKLVALEPLLNDAGKAVLTREARGLQYGIIGEKNVAFELKNSHMPMYILRDVYLHDGTLGAQIDYLVFTKKICFVIECKNLYGNIEINDAGAFTRITRYNDKVFKEGIYSPVTQNERHIGLMKKIRMDNADGLIRRLLVGKFFKNRYKSIVVLANPKTLVHAKFAKKEIKNQVIRADQLVSHIKAAYNASKEPVLSDDELFDWAQSFLDLHRDVIVNYQKKYAQYLLEASVEEPKPSPRLATPFKKPLPVQTTGQEPTMQKASAPMKNDDDLREVLKNYRLTISRREQVKPYAVFHDSHLSELIMIKPVNLTALRRVSGFGEVRVNKYGNDIVAIIRQHVSQSDY